MEARQAASFAKDLGLDTEILTWRPGDIQSSLQERARRARYALLGDACRLRGMEHLMTAHTRDDQAETLLMRYDRETNWRGAGGMRVKAYAPLWPELAKLILYRPLLKSTRADLRNYNRKHNIRWIEDPSNQDLKFSRIQARQKLSKQPELASLLLEAADDLQFGLTQERAYFNDMINRNVQIDEFGLIRVYGSLPSPLWSKILRIASGTGGPIEPSKIKDLIQSLHLDNFKGQTLADAYVTRDLWRLCVGRDPSFYKGRQNKRAKLPLKLEKKQAIIWDGRFEITALQSGLKVMTAHDAFKFISEDERLAINPYLPSGMFRGAHPVVLSDKNHVMNRTDKVDMKCLGQARLQRL